MWKSPKACRSSKRWFLADTKRSIESWRMERSSRRVKWWTLARMRSREPNRLAKHFAELPDGRRVGTCFEGSIANNPTGRTCGDYGPLRSPQIHVDECTRLSR